MYDPARKLEIAYWYRDDGHATPRDVGYTVKMTPPGGTFAWGALHIHDLRNSRGQVDAHMKFGHYKTDSQSNPMDDGTAVALFVQLMAMDKANIVPWDSMQKHKPPKAKTGFVLLNTRIDLAMIKRVTGADDFELFKKICKLHNPKLRRIFWDNDAWDELRHWMLG